MLYGGGKAKKKTQSNMYRGSRSISSIRRGEWINPISADSLNAQKVGIRPLNHRCFFFFLLHLYNCRCLGNKITGLNWFSDNLIDFYVGEYAQQLLHRIQR
jgi:hypothetical protein